MIDKRRGLLVVDDTTLDKPYAQKNKVQKMGLVSRHWSGKHHAVVEGTNLTTLLWTDGLSSLPCDCRLYEPVDMNLPKTAKPKSRKTIIFSRFSWPCESITEL